MGRGKGVEFEASFFLQDNDPNFLLHPNRLHPRFLWLAAVKHKPYQFSILV